MGRKAKAAPSPGGVDGPSAIAVPDPRQDPLSVVSGYQSLIALAEEFGRLLARRELSRPGRRRGFSLPELLIGAGIVALMWSLAARAFGLLPP